MTARLMKDAYLSSAGLVLHRDRNRGLSPHLLTRISMRRNRARVALVISSAGESLVRSVWVVSRSAAFPCSHALATRAWSGPRSRSTRLPGCPPPASPASSPGRRHPPHRSRSPLFVYRSWRASSRITCRHPPLDSSPENRRQEEFNNRDA